MTFAPTKYRKKVEELNIKIYTEGRCFLCGNDCEQYAHFECALAYSDHKDHMMKKINEHTQGWN